MNIAHVKISNILGIEELEFDAGQFNTITARNGSGKTSVLEAIKAAFRGGHDATLLRAGADKGEVVLVLDNGDEIVRRVSASKSDTVIRRDGRQVARPAEIIKGLTDLLSVNPVEFLRAPAKERARVLLESMPMPADTARLYHITGQRFIGPEPDALVVIDRLQKQIYDQRTGVNRAAKEKEATVEQLRGSLPAAPAGVQSTDEEALQKQLDDAGVALEAERKRVSDKLAAMRADHENRMEDLRRQMEEAKTAFADIQDRASKQLQKAGDQHAAQTMPIREALAAIRANRDAAAKRQQQMVIIEDMDKQAAELRAESDKLTGALAALDAYRLELLSKLPIRGLEIRDGELYRAGVHFDRLNTAQQVQIAVEIAKLRAGNLKACCVDGLELLDSASWDAFREAAQAGGLQLFVTRVSDGDFAIQAEGGGV